MTNSFTTVIDSTDDTVDKSPQMSTVKVRGSIEDSRSSAQEEETRNMEKPMLWDNLVTMMFYEWIEDRPLPFIRPAITEANDSIHLRLLFRKPPVTLAILFKAVDECGFLKRTTERLSEKAVKMADAPNQSYKAASLQDVEFRADLSSP
jgi:hypothetical protein